MATRKAKRKLSDISFEKEGAHVALVSKDQGGPANLHDYALVLKANNFSEEFIQKMQQVKVTLELPDFLQKFFGLYYEDAEVLARFMGYQPPESETQDVAISYEDYIQSKLQSFEVLKAANDSESLAQVLSELDETEYLAMLQDQEYLEQVFKQAEAKTESDTSVQVTKADDTSPACEVKEEEVSTSVIKEELEKSMDENQVEMVEKSALESIQKAFEEQKEALEKALATVAQFEAEKKEAIVKAKTEQVKAVVKDESKLEIVAKAALALESEDDFAAFLTAVEGMQAAVEASEMFVEKGATTEEVEPAVQESAVAKVLKAKLNK